MQLENARVNISTSNSVMLAEICGEIDHHSSKDIREAIDASLVSEAPDRLCLDFSGVNFMDSSGLGLLLGRYTKATNAGIEFSVTGTTENVQRMFDMAGLRRIINFTEENNSNKEKENKK